MTFSLSRLTRGAISALVVLPAVLAATVPASATVSVGSSIDLLPLSAAITDSYQVQFSPLHPLTQAYGVKSAQNEVAVINPFAGTVVDTISVGAGPAAIAFAPDGNFAYVANYDGDSTSIIDTSTNMVSDTVNVAGGPYDVTVSPNGKFAAFSCYDDDTIRIMSTTTNSIVKSYKIRGSGVWQARYTPNGKRLYAVANTSGHVIVIDTAKKKVIKKIAMRGMSWWLDVSPDGKTVVVTDYIADDSTVDVISVTKNKVTDTVDVGSSAYAVTFTPDGDFFYVTNDSTDLISVVDSSTLDIVDSFTSSGSAPLITTFNPSGTLGYIGDRYGLITTFTP